MNKKIGFYGFFATLFLTMVAAGSAFAQQAEQERAALFGNVDLPSFFICVVGGLLLAIAFQTVLTLFSVAAGVTAVGNIEEKTYHDDWNRDRDEQVRDFHHRDERGRHPGDDRDQDHDRSTPMGVKFTSAVGLWTLITVSVSLFLASNLAVRLSLIDVNFIGVTLGLIIWASFFTLMVYLEVKMVSSLLGGLISMALSSIRTGFGAISGTFGKSRKDEMKEVAAYTVEHARKELADMLNTSKLDKRMDKWVKTLRPDYTSMRRELASLIRDIEIREEETLGREGVTREMFLNVTNAVPHLSERERHHMGEMFDEIKAAARTEGRPADKVMAAVDRTTPGTEEDTREFRRKVEQYLRETRREEINPDTLRRDLEYILAHPSRSPEVIMNRLSQLDRNTFIAALEQRRDISRQDAERYVHYAEQAINSIRSSFSSTHDKFNKLDAPSRPGDQQEANMPPRDGRQETTDLRNAEMGVIHTDRGDRVVSYAPAEESMMSGQRRNRNTSAVEAQLRGFFDRMPGREWDYNRIRRDFINMYHDPAAAPHILSQRLSQYDRDSMISLLENTGMMSRDRAERIADLAIEAKEEVIRRAHDLERQARMQVEQAKEFALHQAEATRKTAVAASWWLLGTALVSALAAALGGVSAL